MPSSPPQKDGGELRKGFVSGRRRGDQLTTKAVPSNGALKAPLIRLPDRLPATALSKTRNPAAPPPECFLPARLWSLREFRIRGAVRSGLENSPLAGP